MIIAIKKDDVTYPRLLKEIHSPPKVLYVNGSILPDDDMAVAIVGSRRASVYGLQMSERFGYELAVRGVTVVSGMARGIDTAAHRGALRAKGRTIAVMGCGHDTIYPPENRTLYREIAKTGAVVSEFADDVAPIPRNFPIRNRIISGLSLGIVVIEAAKDSGALITADFAVEQDREVFAIPGMISSTASVGTNALIKDGATLVQSVDDILEELSLRPAGEISGGQKRDRDEDIARKTARYIYNSLTDDERSVYKALGTDPVHIDVIGDLSGLDTAKMSIVIMQLLLKKVIKELPGKNFIRS